MIKKFDEYIKEEFDYDDEEEDFRGGEHSVSYTVTFTNHNEDWLPELHQVQHLLSTYGDIDTSNEIHVN